MPSPSGAYWQNLPNALQEANVRTWYTVVASQPQPEPPQRVSVDTSPPPTSILPAPEKQAEWGDRWDRLAQCESTMKQKAVSPNGLYLSYFQWVLGTWYGAGGTGDPRNASYAEQKTRAKTLSNPEKQWPVCWAKTAE